MLNKHPLKPNLSETLRNQFGDIDIYVFDALLQGRWRPEHRFLDAGCGTGRNLPCFLDAGFDVWAMDSDEDALEVARELAALKRPDMDPKQFQCTEIARHSLPENHFHAVLCNAVLHFSAGHSHFQDSLFGLWRALAPNGTLLIRLGTRIGIERDVLNLGNGRYQQPDGAQWFLPSADELLDAEKRLGAQRLLPLKSTLVDGRRCMSTWWLKKPAGFEAK
jgi:tellurite methyltransferase